MGELDQVLGAATDVRADVEQQHRGGSRDWERQRESGTVDASIAAHVEQAGGERRTGGAAGHERLRTPFGDGPSRLYDRRLPGRTDGERGIGRLRDRDRGIDDLDAGRDVAHLVGGPEQDHAQTGPNRSGRTGRHLHGAEVRPARINGDGDHRWQLSAGLLAGAGDHLAPAVATAYGADAMGTPP